MTRSLTDWRGCPRPQRLTFSGRYVRLEPLDPDIHGDALFAASSVADAVRRFAFLPDHPPADRGDFQLWLDKAAASEDPLFHAVIDLASGQAGGRQGLMRIDAANGVAEIGHIYWGPAISRRPAATEAFFLAADYVFGQLGYRRFEWKCNDRNEPSKRAALRFGFQYEGLFRQHLVVKGENRDTAWFAMLDHEWPALRAALVAWLDPTNFDAQGNQITRLEALRPAGQPVQ